MLAKMYLTNFLSFKDRTEIDFTASKYSILGKTNVCENGILGCIIILSSESFPIVARFG